MIIIPKKFQDVYPCSIDFTGFRIWPPEKKGLGVGVMILPVSPTCENIFLLYFSKM